MFERGDSAGVLPLDRANKSVVRAAQFSPAERESTSELELKHIENMSKLGAMRLVANIQLKPTPEQSKSLHDALARCNAACNEAEYMERLDDPKLIIGSQWLKDYLQARAARREHSPPEGNSEAARDSRKRCVQDHQ